MSDTHGDFSALRGALRMQPKAETVIHLGDGEDDVLQVKAEFPEKHFLQVRGNNDWGSTRPLTGEITVNGVNIFYTHGHGYQVKMGNRSLLSAAGARKARLVLFGHTHVPENCYAEDMYLLNPGSLRGSRGTYGIVDIDEKGGILPVVVKLHSWISR